MKGDYPFRIEENSMNFLEACAEALNLDDLFELALNHILDMKHVRQAEILLFNKKNDLVPLAKGENSSRRINGKRKLIVQSWMIDSAVRHTTRKVKVPPLFTVTTIPLKTSEKPFGFLKIRMDLIRTSDCGLLANLNIAGRYLSAKIKEIVLQEKIRGLSEELHNFSFENKQNRQRITSLSKELYAICAISAKINQSMDIKKSLTKSIAKLKEVFKASAVLVYLKSPGRSGPSLFTRYGNEKNRKNAPELFEQIESLTDRDFFAKKDSVQSGYGPSAFHPQKTSLNHHQYKSMIMAPMRAKRKLVGALVLLYETTETFDQDNLRLLCGIGDIMGMVTENMTLYRQSQQKKKTAAFLVQSISKFNEKLDLAKTLRSIAEKGAEFIGKRCCVYLLTETKIPMIRLHKTNCGAEGSLRTESFYEIEPPALKEFYEKMRHRRRPALIDDIAQVRNIKRKMKTFFDQEGIKRLISVPLTLTGKSMGLMLFCGKGGKGTFDRLDLSVFEALGAAASVAIENSRAYTSSVEMSDFLEVKINEKTAQMQKIQERFQNREENRNEIVFRVNADNRFVFVNKAMEVLTGASREEICREKFKIDNVVAPEDRQRVASCFRIVFNGSLPMIRDLVYRHLGAKGEDRIISLTIYPETGPDGEITGVEGVGRDITEKKRLEKELEKAKDLALLGEFSSAIAHQIRNPLGNILMGTKLLQRSLGLDAEPFPNLLEKQEQNSSFPDRDTSALAGIFGNLYDGINNLNQVVAKLVEYTRTLKLTRSYQHIQVILEENIAMFQTLIGQNGIRVEKLFEPELPVLSVDAVMIGLVFQNIIHNAIQAMPKGGRLIVSAVSCGQKPGYALISVSDMGFGIAPSELEKVFHPFYTTKEAGTGLGLSLAHRIVEAHNGKIWVCLNPCPHFPLNGGRKTETCLPPEKGVSFHILLPCKSKMKRDLRDKAGG